jgi:hypothetical protein
VTPGYLKNDSRLHSHTVRSGRLAYGSDVEPYLIYKRPFHVELLLFFFFLFHNARRPWAAHFRIRRRDNADDAPRLGAAASRAPPSMLSSCVYAYGCTTVPTVSLAFLIFTRSSTQAEALRILLRMDNRLSELDRTLKQLENLRRQQIVVMALFTCMLCFIVYRVIFA